jgi:hypothetical protein
MFVAIFILGAVAIEVVRRLMPAGRRRLVVISLLLIVWFVASLRALLREIG